MNTGNQLETYKDRYEILSDSYMSLREHLLTLDLKDSTCKNSQLLHCPEIPQDIGAAITDIAGPGSERDVYIFSIINWDFRVQRPQHLSTELSKKTRVFYIEMELSPVGNLITRVSENLYVIRLQMGQAGIIEPYHGIAPASQSAGWIENFHTFVDSVSGTSQKSVIIQHPWWWQFAKHFAPEFQITFDCMDDISGFSNTTKEILDLEHDMVESCDHLVVSSQALYDNTAEIRTPILVRNGCALDHFKNYDQSQVGTFTRLQEKASPDTIDIGYVGALAEWFDIDLMEQVVSAGTSMQFHICGDVTHAAILELNKHENVHFYGEINYDTVPDFIAQMDVMIIPFKLTPIIQACDPVKFYEHCIMGVPTVATCMPELVRAGRNVALARDADEFLTHLVKMNKQGKNEDYQQDLQIYAEENCWKRRANHLWEQISHYPLVSIVILNYGDPEWSLGAVHSLTEKGGNYPNMEILVVDNGSSEEHIEILETRIESFGNRTEIKLIKNYNNFGFAKGNNIGIKASKGEYVILLNNDTYVAPGLIFSLVSHLTRDPKLGAIGPLTNNIGNEAKLFVNYPDIDTMIRESKRWCTGYRNHRTPLTVAAYFCVAFRSRDLEQFGYLNEMYGRGMFEDDDHCNVIREKGFYVALAEDAFVHHHLSATFNTIQNETRQALFEENKKIYESRWGKWVPHVYRDKRPDSLLDQ